MANRDGTPIWYELMTGAPDPAQDFYAGITGWTFTADADGTERDYRTIRAGGTAIGGVMRAPEGASFAPVWRVYFAVSDVDAAARRVRALGGRLHVAPQDIPGTGRFALVADPQGATFCLMRDDSGEESTAFAPEKAGHCSWNELVTSDQDAALAFYADLFGWDRIGAMPMGEAGTYTFLGNGGDPIGAMMTARHRAVLELRLHRPRHRRRGGGGHPRRRHGPPWSDGAARRRRRLDDPGARPGRREGDVHGPEGDVGRTAFPTRGRPRGSTASAGLPDPDPEGNAANLPGGT